MSVELDDEATIDRLREEFRGVSFDRTIGGLRPRPHRYAVAGALLLATASGTVALNLDSTPKPSAAWSPTPRVVTPADETRVRQACAAPSNAATVGFHGSYWFPRSNNTSDAPTSPQSSASPTSNSLSLATFDLRGTGGVAVFTNGQQTTTCLLSRNPDGSITGSHFMDLISPDYSIPEGHLTLTTRVSVTFDDGREFTVIAGIAPADVYTVTFTGNGIETTTAFVTDGRFAAWWPTTSIPASGMVQALDEHGKVLLSVASLAPDGSGGTFEAG